LASSKTTGSKNKREFWFLDVEEIIMMMTTMMMMLLMPAERKAGSVGK
jgi:hypothetical protein